MFPDIKTCDITKLVYLVFKLESTYMLSQLKCRSKQNETSGIFETLRENLAFLKMNKCQSQIEGSIRFFLRINPKLALRNVLKIRMEEICTWLYLDDDDTKALTKPSMDIISNFIQESVIPAFDLYHKCFGSGTGNEQIITTMRKIRTSPEHSPILKSIMCKASQLANHPAVQFIIYGMQGITQRDIYKTIIQNRMYLSATLLMLC